MRLLLILLFICLSTPVGGKTYWYFKDDFSANDQQMLKQWIDETKSSVESLVSPFPFPTHIVFYRRHLQKEPVPWANTERDRVQGVRFYVDTRFTLGSFQKDWTASHEISHLLIPWLGDNYRWFAEGLASYLQYQVMYIAGDLNWDKAITRYNSQFKLAAKHRATRRQSVADVSKRMHASRAYKPVYWGGALYFLKVDKRLQQDKGIRLNQVLAKYQQCCRKGARWGDRGFKQLINTLNNLSNSKIFSQQLVRFTEQSGFPEYQADMLWLANNPPETSKKEKG